MEAFLRGYQTAEAKRQAAEDREIQALQVVQVLWDALKGVREMCEARGVQNDEEWEVVVKRVDDAIELGGK